MTVTSPPESRQTGDYFVLAQFAKPIQKIVGGFLVGPVVAGVVDFDGEAGGVGRCGGFIDRHFVGEHGPPAGADKRRIIGFRSLFEGVLTEEIGGR